MSPFRPYLEELSLRLAPAGATPEDPTGLPQPTPDQSVMVYPVQPVPVPPANPDVEPAKL